MLHMQHVTQRSSHEWASIRDQPKLAAAHQLDEKRPTRGCKLLGPTEWIIGDTDEGHRDWELCTNSARSRSNFGGSERPIDELGVNVSLQMR
jgi:hypothetical protein